MKNIFISGATGFIGRRLLKELLNYSDVKITLLVRNKKKLEDYIKEKCNIYEGDITNFEILNQALNNVQVAVYLVHMMGDSEEYLEKEKLSAQLFLDSCKKNNVKRIVYLGGLGEKNSCSKHLLSRYITGEILSSFPEKVKTIWFRAGIIIGSGSASFEIIRNLVQKLPIMIAPKWVNNKTSPIFVDDVINYLIKAIFLEKDIHCQIDIGTSEISFKEMLLKTASSMGLKRFIISVPLLTIRLSSYWLILFTPVNFMIAKELVMGLKSQTIKLNNNANIYFPEIKITNFEDAIKKSVWEIENQQVISRWSNSSKSIITDVPKVSDIPKSIFVDRYTKSINKQDATKLF